MFEKTIAKAVETAVAAALAEHEKKMSEEIDILRRRLEPLERAVKREQSQLKRSHSELMQGPHGGLLSRGR